MTKMIGQKTGVVQAVVNVLGGRFIPGTDVATVLTKQEKIQVRETVFNNILNGAIKYSKSTKDIDSVRRYVNGMVDNHIRKAKELNGNVIYQSKNPGSGRGRRDPQLTALASLLKQYSPGTSEYQDIQKTITCREQELSDQRTEARTKQRVEAKAKSIDFDALPAELHNLVKN